MITIRFTEKNKTTHIIQTKYFYFQKNSDIANEYRNFLKKLSNAYEKNENYYLLHFPEEGIVKEVVSFDLISIDNNICVKDDYFFSKKS